MNIRYHIHQTQDDRIIEGVLGQDHLTFKASFAALQKAVGEPNLGPENGPKTEWGFVIVHGQELDGCIIEQYTGPRDTFIDPIKNPTRTVEWMVFGHRDCDSTNREFYNYVVQQLKEL